MPTPAPGGSDNTQMEASGVCNLPPHVAMLVSPGMGHLIPFAELARRLAARHGITATLITFASTSSATQRAFLASLPPTIASISLPRVNLSDLPAGAAIETLMSEECVRVLPALTGVLSELRATTRLVAFVADIFGAVLLALRVHGVLGPLDEPLRDVGLLVPSWAPQIKVLAQEATGGFLVHCGWNSVLESLVHGVPMVAWPLYAEQRQNAVLLTEGVGAVIRVPDTKNKHEIAMAVKEVMAGQGKGAEVRAKVAKLQKVAMEGLREGGAATTV